MVTPPANLLPEGRTGLNEKAPHQHSGQQKGHIRHGGMHCRNEYPTYINDLGTEHGQQVCGGRSFLPERLHLPSTKYLLLHPGFNHFNTAVARFLVVFSGLPAGLSRGARTTGRRFVELAGVIACASCGDAGLWAHGREQQSG